MGMRNPTAPTTSSGNGDASSTLPANLVEGLKARVPAETARLREVADRIRPEVEGRLSMAISKPFFLEFTDNGIDKRHSLARLCAHLGIDLSDVVAIGDGNNDAGMIHLAGLGISMANGAPEVRAIADHVTGSNMEDGVAQAVERFVLAKA